MNHLRDVLIERPHSAADGGRRALRPRWRGWSLVLDVRTLVVCAGLAILIVVFAIASLATGDYPLTAAQVVSAIVGNESGIVHTVVMEWRMPRLIAAICLGAALAVAGAIFQSLTRNPLASPDVLGFVAGSYSGALVVMMTVGASYVLTAVGSLIGGAVTATAVYLLANRRGVQPMRLIVVGIGVAAMLQALNTWLILRADLEVAIGAAAWGMGSLNATNWEQATGASLVVTVLLLATGALSPAMRQLELGDDAATALGVRVRSTRLVLLLIGVALTAAATAVAGPIAFLALAAPQIARRLARSSGVSVLASAFTGALLLVLADYIAHHLLPSTLPVGTVTIVIGGAYLVWLLIHEVRRRS